jgi:hypothetical protein
MSTSVNVECVLAVVGNEFLFYLNGIYAEGKI